MSPNDRFVGYLEDFGRGILGLLWLLLVVALRVGLPLALIFGVVYLAVKAAS